MLLMTFDAKGIEALTCPGFLDPNWYRHRLLLHLRSDAWDIWEPDLRLQRLVHGCGHDTLEGWTSMHIQKDNIFNQRSSMIKRPIHAGAVASVVFSSSRPSEALILGSRNPEESGGHRTGRVELDESVVHGDILATCISTVTAFTSRPPWKRRSQEAESAVPS